MNHDIRHDPLDAISQISCTINTVRELDPLLNTIMDIALQTVQAERGFILLLDDAGEFTVQTARNIADDVAIDLSRFSNNVVKQALSQGNPVMAFDVQADDRFAGAESIVLQKIQSVACVPLTIKQRSIGAIYLDSIQQRSGFTDDSLPFLKAFANQAAIAIENARLYEQLQQENQQLRKHVQEAHRFDGIIGSSPAMQRVFDTMTSVADTDATVLIQGESGTGKELIARAIHYNGVRKDKPFLALFCGSLPESLLESELFGHKKGAFTGAAADKKGLFEAADKGTFFLDEVSELSPHIQVQLLRVLQEGEIKRVGETQIRHVDVRIIAATNKNLFEEVKNGNFREDLYYRLNVINVNVPRLRERHNDIMELAGYFLEKSSQKNKKAINSFTPEAVQALKTYSWPGNVRELQNTIERAVVLSRQTKIDRSDLQLQDNPTPSLPIGVKLKDFERQLVERTLSETNGNITETAAQLGVSRRWLHYRLKEWKDEDDR
ncbi:sigma 54-interacting transcriptional regulator [candidate division KSB1 bacterium]|nr:sigma 54-interacting transcriptional regulator [candidate division KSB1 bacterium]